MYGYKLYTNWTNQSIFAISVRKQIEILNKLYKNKRHSFWLFMEKCYNFTCKNYSTTDCKSNPNIFNISLCVFSESSLDFIKILNKFFEF